jgi:hypothetical protein
MPVDIEQEIPETVYAVGISRVTGHPVTAEMKEIMRENSQTLEQEMLT